MLLYNTVIAWFSDFAHVLATDNVNETTVQGWIENEMSEMTPSQEGMFLLSDNIWNKKNNKSDRSS